MGRPIGLKVQPDGAKILELRKRIGLKQETLANDAKVSLRLLRYIERENRPVHSRYITDIATVLKVSPDQITVPTPASPLAAERQITVRTSDSPVTAEHPRSISPYALQESEDPRFPELKLRTIRSACELYSVAGQVHLYAWDLSVDPSVATAKEMQQLLRIVRRIVEGGTDEFDSENAGPTPDPDEDVHSGHEGLRYDIAHISRLARLQQSLETLRAGGVGVLAGAYFRQLLTTKGDKRPGTRPIKFGDNEHWLKLQGILEIRFVPVDVDEKIISIDIGVSPNHPESLESLTSQLDDEE
jgi:transcriptional regulator with XRE-family HTH domain